MLENLRKYKILFIIAMVLWAKSLRSWALEVISVKASEYLEKLNTKIQRISLSEKNTKVDITCYSRNTTLELESLSGGEQVSIAFSA